MKGSRKWARVLRGVIGHLLPLPGPQGSPGWTWEQMAELKGLSCPCQGPSAASPLTSVIAVTSPSSSCVAFCHYCNT